MPFVSFRRASRIRSVVLPVAIILGWSKMVACWIPHPRQPAISTKNQWLDHQDTVPRDAASVKSSGTVLTSAILNITYDGGRFTGWSAANDDTHTKHKNSTSETLQQEVLQQERLSTKQRRKGKRRGGNGQGFVRSVESVLRTNLARLYSNADPGRVQLEGCSRTDKGVHAHSMIAQFYCLSSDAYACLKESSDRPADNSTSSSKNSQQNDESTISPMVFSIPGKRTPHPTCATDSTYFEPLPFDDLSKIRYTLNRMLPDDVRIQDISPSPTKTDEHQLPFHPTLDSALKTYEYTFSVGYLHDPTNWRFVWHIDGANEFNLDRARSASQLLLGTRDYGAFRGAPRGSDDKRRQRRESTTCTITNIDIVEVVDNYDCAGPLYHSSSTKTYKIIVTGNRFLYKMVRFLVGSLVAVGTDRMEFGDMQTALDTGKWSKTFMCAPPHGLALIDVSYGSDIQFEWV